MNWTKQLSYERTNKRMEVLIVEDDPVYAHLMRRMLQTITTDEKITSVENMDEAMASIVKHASNNCRFELITLDLNLNEEYKGETTLKKIEELKLNNDGGLLLVVSGISGLDVERIRKYGADGFIAKNDLLPSTFSEVFGRLVKNLVSRPMQYQRNITILEKLTAKFVEQQTQTT